MTSISDFVAVERSVTRLIAFFGSLCLNRCV